MPADHRIAAKGDPQKHPALQKQAEAALAALNKLEEEAAQPTTTGYVKRVNSNGQPDPTRTSIDSLGATPEQELIAQGLVEDVLGPYNERKARHPK